jgi:hypothetical protein
MNLKKENQISTPFGKRDEMGNDFPLFPFVLPYFAPSFGRRKRYLPFGTKEILFFLIGC